MKKSNQDHKSELCVIKLEKIPKNFAINVSIDIRILQSYEYMRTINIKCLNVFKDNKKTQGF